MYFYTFGVIQSSNNIVIADTAIIIIFEFKTVMLCVQL